MYSSFLEINKNFQTSINLELDLQNKAKIAEYIPTKDICDVLSIYLSAALGKNKDKATLLVGPYGKGKSFLLLVMTFILGKQKGSKEWKNLEKKIRKIDSNVADLMLEIKEKNITLLPVLINSNYDNIVQSFQLALNEAFIQNGLEEIIPQNAFTICISLLNKWIEDHKTKTMLEIKCKELQQLDLNRLKSELELFSPEAYKKFIALYNCMNIGLDFNPLISNDIIKTFRDVNLQLPKHGFSGILVIFDEFSKFLESNSSDVSKDLKLIQDFAEMSARSERKNPLLLCCVAHKSLTLYKKDRSLDLFKTVEGRFTEIRFNRSLDENFQIIGSVIQKRKNAKKEITNYLNNHTDFYGSILDLQLFSFDNIEKELFYNCFPLNPITAYLLIQLSEIVAQNERTLFSFLSDSDENSFNSFIHSNEDGLFNVDKIFDYFSDLLQKEEQNSIRNYWYRAHSILSKVDDILERKIIKTLAIILMINDTERFPTSTKLISLSLCVNEQIIINKIGDLVNRHFLRKNLLTNYYSFAGNNSKNIDDKIDYLSKTKFRNIRVSSVLSEINERRFIIPRKYNEKMKISRFYSVVFLSEEEFMKINSFTLFFEERYCDGIVIYLLRENLSLCDIKKKMDQIGDIRVVVKFPIEPIDSNLYDLALRYKCLNEIYIENVGDEVLSQEILLLSDECKEDILFLIEKYFEDQCEFYSLCQTNEKFNSVLSLILERIYTKEIIFNYELVNKKKVSSQYQKAVCNVITYLLTEGKKEFMFSDTSPESSIKRIILEKNADNPLFAEVIEYLKFEIFNSNDEKRSVSKIMQKLTLPPYGIRKGILPLLLAKAISELSSENVLLYFQGKEIDLNAENIIKTIDNDKYYIRFSKQSKNMQIYLKKMMMIFDATDYGSYKKNITSLTSAIKRYYYSLPNIVRSSTEKNNILMLSTEEIRFKNIFMSFNINPFDAVFESTKEIFNTKNYDEIIGFVMSIKEEEKEKMSNYLKELIALVKEKFKIYCDTSLKMGVSNWLSMHIDMTRTPILEETQAALLKMIREESSFDDTVYVEHMIHALSNTFIEDWGKDNRNQIALKIDDFIETIHDVHYLDQQEEQDISSTEYSDYSPMGSLLKNNISSVIDEYSDSVPATEKVEILKGIIKELLKVGE